MSVLRASRFKSPVVGIDPSLTSLGIAYKEGGMYRAEALASKNAGLQRIVDLREYVSRRLDALQPSLVVYEGYALGYRGKSNTIFTLGELGGALKLLILGKGIDILLVPPNNLKLYITGKGNADKGLVAKVIQEQLGVTYSTSDQYDATGLLLMGEAYSDQRSLPRSRNSVQRVALAGVQYIPANAIDFKSR